MTGEMKGKKQHYQNSSKIQSKNRRQKQNLQHTYT